MMGVVVVVRGEKVGRDGDGSHFCDINRKEE